MRAIQMRPGAQRKHGPPGRLVVWLALATLMAGGCDGIFEVENPNQLVEDDFSRPEAATALVNGAQASLARALSRLVLPLSIVSDELTSIGSLDFGRELDEGTLTNPSNDVTNSAFPFVAEARFMADEAIARLRTFEAEGRLASRSDLARAYLYGAIVYIYIADAYDDFVISDRREAAPPIGEHEMEGLYVRAIEYLDEGLAIARSTGAGELELSILAQRARARHARGVWRILDQAGAPAAQPLVADAAAVADAEAALELTGGADWKLQLGYSAGSVGSALGGQVNVRQEYRLGDEYIMPTADGKRAAGVRLLDPIEEAPDPALAAAVQEFVGAGEYPNLTIVSARELYLILAEAALAEDRREDAAALLNALRAFDDLQPWTGQISLGDLLRHERRVNLFLQGRRLADHYRFGIPDAAWHASSDAALAPGTFFPIAQVERLSNCHIAGGCR